LVVTRVIVLCDQYRVSRPGAVSTRVWVLRLAATAYTIGESTGSDYRSGEVMYIPVECFCVACCRSVIQCLANELCVDKLGDVGKVKVKVNLKFTL
jgi:hypothetical protein